MKSASELAVSLTKEHMEVTKRIVKIERFMKTDDYDGLEVKEQRLLVIQRNAMLVYADVLLQRIDEAKDQESMWQTFDPD